jgi:Tol biopolymer transport system component
VVWLDDSGKMRPLLATPAPYALPRLSPDGSKLAFGNGGDIFIHDSERDTTTRLTFTGQAHLPVWAPDGKRFAVLALPDAAAGTKGSVHVTMLQSFFDELRRKLP